jgi:rifampicin phosphotransferase
MASPPGRADTPAPCRSSTLRPKFDRLRAGDVLVCRVFLPVWTVLFPHVGALVTESGGILSNPAIVARECGVPSVVATRMGTTVLRDGQLVIVDGTSGTVEVVR